MRIPLHPAAWIGFLLNCIVAFLFMSALSSIDLSVFTAEEQQILGMVLDQADTIRMIFYTVLAMQLIALGLLATRAPFGLVLAFLGALLMLPGSLFYLIGCLLTHYRNKFADFSPAPPGYDGARLVFNSAAAPILRIASAAAIVLSVLSVFTGWMNMGAVCFGASLAGLYFAVRSRRNAPLALYYDHFTVTPGLCASNILVPYTSVRVATLRADQSILFEVDGPKGILHLAWSLRSIEKSERRQALEELGAELSRHSVPLEQQTD